MAKIKIKPLVCIMLAAAVCFLSVQTSFALEKDSVPKAEDIDTDRELSLRIDFVIDSVPVAFARIGIYKVADVYTQGGAVFYTALIGDYDYEGITASESSEIAYELSLSAPDEADIYISSVTDAGGSAAFDIPEAGIYLVVLESSVYDDEGAEYTFEPFLACVPLAMEEDGVYVWTYDVVSEPKTAQINISETQEEGSPQTGEGPQLLIWISVFCGACAYILSIAFMEKRTKAIQKVKAETAAFNGGSQNNLKPVWRKK